MNKSYVNLEAAQALKDLGYPQGEGVGSYYQLIIRRQWMWNYGTEEECINITDFDCLADPTPLEALDWLEQEKGIKYGRQPHNLLDQWYYLTDYGSRSYKNPNELILAIYVKIREEQDATN